MAKHRVNIRLLWMTIAIGAFFEPLSLQYMQNYNFHPEIGRAISLIYTFLKIIFSIDALIKVCIKRKTKRDIIGLPIWLVTYFFSIIVSCAMNNSFSLTVVMSNLQQIGFVFFLYYNLSSKPHLFQRACLRFFGFFSFLCVLNVIFLPNGFFSSRGELGTIYSAIFVFGGKNASFPYFCCFIVLLITSNSKKSQSRKVVLSIILVLFSTIRCQSVNSTICISLILLIWVIKENYVNIYNKLTPILSFSLVAIILAIIYSGSLVEAYTGFLQIFGRNATLSSRTMIWSQAIYNFTTYPLFGVGNVYQYSLKYTTTGHAHSQYLDRLSKYGLFSFVILIQCIIYYIRNIRRYKDNEKCFFFAASTAVYMLHMGFDVYNINFLIFLLLFSLNMLNTESRVCFLSHNHAEA